MGHDSESPYLCVDSLTWLWMFSQTRCTPLNVFFCILLLWLTLMEVTQQSASPLCPQSITLWTVWCQRPSSAFSWRPLAITRCSSLRMIAASAFFKGRPSASPWRRKASVVSWASSWSLRCLLGSFRIGSWERHVPKVDPSLKDCTDCPPCTKSHTSYAGGGTAVILISSGWTLSSAGFGEWQKQSHLDFLKYSDDSFFPFYFKSLALLHW